MAGSLLDIYGNYNQAYRGYENKYNAEAKRYQNEANIYNTALDKYLGEVDAYNAAGAEYQKLIDAYNATLITDPGAYRTWFGGTSNQYQGSGPYTTWNDATVGRVNPIETYQATRYETGGVDEWGNPYSVTSWYDPRTGLGRNPENPASVDTTANADAYLNPETGLVSLFAPRPGDFGMATPTFNLSMPVFNEPIAPNAPPPLETNQTGNIPAEELYQRQFGRTTPDVMSNEAWSLSNISTPFFSTEPSTIYETGGVNALNNPLSYVSPNALTTGQQSVDQNSLIGGQNPYYLT